MKLAPSLLSLLLVLVFALGSSPAMAQLTDLLPELPRTEDGVVPETTEPPGEAQDPNDAVQPDAPAPQQAESTPPPPPNAPKEEPTNEAAEWWVSPAGKALGPYTVSQLRQMAADGKIDGDTPVWKDGMSEWVLLKTVAGLEQVVAAVPKSDEPDMPPPPQDNQKLLDDQMKKFLIGTWGFEKEMNQGGVSYYYRVELTYRADGSYAGYELVQMPPQYGVTPPPITNPRSGTYRITAIDEKHFILTLNDRSGSSGAGGQGNQASLRIVDQNTVEDANNPELRSYRIR